MRKLLLPDCSATTHGWRPVTALEKEALEMIEDKDARRISLGALVVPCLYCGIRTTRAAFTVDHILRLPESRDDEGPRT